MSPTRRALLRRASAAGVLGLLAGCTDGGLGGGNGPDGGTDTPTATETTTATPTPTAQAETTADETQDSMGDGTTTDTEPPSTEVETEPEPTTEERATSAETTTEQTETTTRETTTTETATAEPAESKTVALEGFAFNPVRAFVDPGTTVRWVNEDNAAHDVTSAQFHDAAESWDLSQGLSGGASVSYTFESAGVYEYYCTIHGRSSMCGAIVVGDASLSDDLPCESGGYGGGGGGGGYGGGDDGDDDDDGGYAIDGLGR